MLSLLDIVSDKFPEEQSRMIDCRIGRCESKNRRSEKAAADIDRDMAGIVGRLYQRLVYPSFPEETKLN